MFGMNVNKKCMQEYDPEDNAFCSPELCAKCGWNIDVYNRRVVLLREFGLTKCEDGLERLIV